MSAFDQGLVQQEVQGTVLVLTLSNPPVNVLGAAVRAGLMAGLDRAERDDELTAVVIRGAGRGFSAGADLREFDQPARLPLLTTVCSRIEAFGKPVVAAMHGAAYGGGMELGLSAHARVATSEVRLCLPEVKLGLLPGAGGTQRLPRLIGAEAALQMMCFGAPIAADAALQLGLLDGVVQDGDDLLEAALGLAASASAVSPRPGLRDPVAYETTVASMRREMAKSGSLAKMRIVDCVEAALLLPIEQGLIYERAAFDDLRISPEAAALRYLFLAERRTQHAPEGFDARAAVPVTHVGIWGAGAGAVGLVGAALKSGLKVTLCDPSREALVAVLQAVGQAQETAVAAGALSTAARDADWARLIPATDPMAFSGAEAIILTEAERPLVVDFARGLAPQIAVVVVGGVPDGAIRDVMGVVFTQSHLTEVALVPGMSSASVATGLGLLNTLGLRRVITGQTGKGPGIGARVVAAGRLAAQQLIASGVPLAQVVRAVAPFLRLPMGISDGKGALVAIQDGAIADRVLAAMANEGARQLSEGVARHPSDIDVVMVDGFGFARSMGGPMYDADVQGLMVLRRNLRIWADIDPVWAPDPLFDLLIAESRNFGTTNPSGDWVLPV